MKKLLTIALASFVFSAGAWDQVPPQPVQACVVQAPYGFPQTAKPVVGICRHAYVTAFDTAAKIPVWTAYVLLPQNALGCVPRSNAFAADASIPNGPTPQDYAGTGYDKGHVAPDGDMSFDQQAEFESFLMTNMTPQAPGINRGIWKLLETSVRGWAAQTGSSYTVYAGPYYGAGDKTVGKGVVVPHGYFKIVINNNTHQVAGWQFPNTGNLGNNLVPLRTPVVTIEQTAGITFPMPPSAVELQPGQEWPVDFGALTRAKKAKCGASASAD